MKLTDIIDESQLDEFIPLTKQGRMIRKAEKAGAADLKQSVDDLTSEFAADVQRQGLGEVSNPFRALRLSPSEPLGGCRLPCSPPM